MKNNKCYVYAHYKKSNGDLFYIGIGSDIAKRRAYSKRYRNQHWINVINKHDFTFKILFDNITWEEACDKEIELIKTYGRKDLGLGGLVNLTDGGEGRFGSLVSEDTKNKIKRSKLKSGWRHTVESKAKLSIASKGRKNKPHSEETKRKIALNHTNMKKEFNPFYGKKHTEETLNKMKLIKKDRYNGDKNPNAKKVIDINTNKIYNCIKDAAKELNLHYSTLINKLNGYKINDTNIRFIKTFTEQGIEILFD